MKKVLFPALFFFFIGLFAAVPEGWVDTVEAGTAAARKSGRPVLVLFTGSDWCPWCVKLHGNVLSSPEFIDFSRSGFELVYLDYTRNTDAARASYIRKKMRSLCGSGAGFPSAVVLDAGGAVLGTVSGYADKAEYMNKLRSVLSK